MAESQQIERGAYEVIRDRLIAQGRALAEKAEALNKRRMELFGGQELAVVGNERIRTENNCIPRSIVAIGDRLLFAYNVFLGLRTEIGVGDVFSLHTFRRTGEGFSLEPASDADFLADPRFVKDFGELTRYYKDAKLLHARRLDGKLLAVLQIGAKIVDTKAFRWSISPAGKVSYIDNRGERDDVYPPSHDFEWTQTTRENHVAGRHPHVNILDTVFVETVGGDLTVKVEDNTTDGLGIYREPVEDPRQALDDADIWYAKVGGLILIKVLPYHEKVWRYLVFNTRTRQVERIDAIGLSCVSLPEDHGIIFPGGYTLQTGVTRAFDADVSGMTFKRAIRSPNGEDVLYVFHRADEGRFALLGYNLIRKEVQTPIFCHGYTIFEDGLMVIFRSTGAEATRVHPMQVWQTPFTSDEFAAKAPVGDSYLAKVGNAELVRGISDCLSLRRAIEEQKPSVQIYEDLIAAATRALDQYYWLSHAEVGGLAPLVTEIRATAELIVDEFEKVVAIRKAAEDAVAAASRQQEELLRRLRAEDWTTVDGYVGGLAELRRQRGHLISLKDMRYADVGRIDALEKGVIERFDALSRGAVEFLLRDEALAPYHARIGELLATGEAVQKVTDADPVLVAIDEVASQVDLLTEVVGGLAISDATVRTQILEAISEVLGALNRARAVVAARRRELLGRESVAEFGAQFKLLSQNVQSALVVADTPEKCDEGQSRLLLQLEDLEGRFSEFDEFLVQLATKREELTEAFAAKKQSLMEVRQRKAQSLMDAADRILTGIVRRSAQLGTGDELNAYFAADPMVAKIRDVAQRLRELGDSVRADEVESRIKAAREEAGRTLRDRQDLFEEGASLVRLGRHRFSVNTQALDLTMLPRGDGMAVHLLGTDFFEVVSDAELEATRPYWDQQLVSETPEVYRAEYLATSILFDAEVGKGLSMADLRDAALAEGGLLALVRRVAAERYDEGYERGLHDADAALILEKLHGMSQTAGLLRFPPAPRAYAALFWAFFDDAKARGLWERKARSLVRMREAFAYGPAIGELQADLAAAVASFFEARELLIDPEDARIAGAYLLEEIARTPQRFVASAEALALQRAFTTDLDRSGALRELLDDLRALDGDPTSQVELVRAWLGGWLQADAGRAEHRHVVEEAVVLMVTERRLDREPSSVVSSVEVTGLLGHHGRITNRTMSLRLDEVLSRLLQFRHVRVPGFRAYQAVRHKVLEAQRRRLRLSEYTPRIMSSFVRNRLIDEVYLPLIGDNLAKQLGAAGAGKRTDLMGMLLLVSPPGYGKTTLMEYVATRLGLVFMKINGPSLGHSVTSLDPAEAPNATARQEVEKINLALEMGNNVMLYLDDIQHTNPELLQKFISLCDATRKIEGVWGGRTRTYDLRGKKFCVVMAGNPYTESGEKFQIPDMLANRADTYNLGDILDGKEELFALSYIENSLTSNQVLAPLTTRDPKDVRLIVRMALGEEIATSELSTSWTSAELQDVISVVRKLMAIQKVVLRVNLEYIRSASQDDAYRTEPPFKLQGSYRNMNKMAQRVVPVMNEAELQALIDDHYLGEAQTLTTGAEQNLLKLAELRGRMTAEQAARWAEIKKGFQRQVLMGGKEDDPVTRVTGQLGLLSERLESIAGTIQGAAREAATRQVEAAERQAEATAKVAERQAEAAAKVAEAQVEAAAKTAELVAKAGAAPRTDPSVALAPYLRRLDEILRTLSKAQLGVEIVNMPPPAIHELLERQIQVVELSLIPLLRSMGHHLKGQSEIWNRLTDILAALRHVDRATLANVQTVREVFRPFEPDKEEGP
ncbi:MAG: hypothetical protein AMXMBFR64_42230 [Myxococcales bacterium]